VAATAYTLSGPASGTVNVASSNFTVTPVGGPFTGTITPTDGGAGGTFAPASLTWTAASDAKTFTYTPATVGIHTIAATNSGGLSNPSGVDYMANAAPATCLMFTGPTALEVGQAAMYTLTPDGVYTGSVTFSADAAGAFSPTVLAWSGTSEAQTVTFTISSRTGVALTATPTGLPALSPITATGVIRPTSYTMSGPLTLLFGQAATLTFALPPDTDPNQDVEVTPDVSGGTGTFSPTTVTLGAAAMTAELTYTPTCGGTHTISAVNDQGLTNPPVLIRSVRSSSKPKGKGYLPPRVRRV